MGQGQAHVVKDYPTNIYPSRVGDWKIGDITVQPNTCVSIGAVSEKCYKSGEWRAIPPTNFDGNSCCYVGGGINYGAEFHNGTCAGCHCDGCDGACLLREGRPIKCQLERYLANPVECAFSGLNPIEIDGIKYTCNPDWLPNGSKNESIKKNYCETGDNLIHDKRCFDFCKYHDCTSAISKQCSGNNLNTDICKKYCFSSETDYDCSTQLLEYCSNPDNFNQSQCACYLPIEFYDEYYNQFFGGKAPETQTIINQINKLPECSYTPCSAGKYKSRQFYKTTCPIQSICVQKIEINNNGEIYFNGDFEFRQTCQMLFGMGDKNIDPPYSINEFPSWLIAVIIISVIIIIILIFVLIYFFKK